MTKKLSDAIASLLGTPAVRHLVSTAVGILTTLLLLRFGLAPVAPAPVVAPVAVAVDAAPVSPAEAPAPVVEPAVAPVPEAAPVPVLPPAG